HQQNPFASIQRHLCRSAGAGAISRPDHSAAISSTPFDPSGLSVGETARPIACRTLCAAPHSQQLDSGSGFGRPDALWPSTGRTAGLQPQEERTALLSSIVVLRRPSPRVLARVVAAGELLGQHRSGPLFRILYGQDAALHPALAHSVAGRLG